MPRKALILSTLGLFWLAGGCSKEPPVQHPVEIPKKEVTDFSKPKTPHPKPRPDYIGIGKNRF